MGTAALVGGTATVVGVDAAPPPPQAANSIETSKLKLVAVQTDFLISKLLLKNCENWDIRSYKSSFGVFDYRTEVMLCPITSCYPYSSLYPVEN